MGDKLDRAVKSAHVYGDSSGQVQKWGINLIEL